MFGFASAGRGRNPVTEGQKQRQQSWEQGARGQLGIATPPDCTRTKAIDNDVTDRITGSRRACTRVSVLKRMREVNSAADETI